MIYFDNSATTKPYPEALQSYVTVAGKYFGNPSSIHSLGGESERLLTQSRTIAAQLLRVKPSEIVFTSGGTEGNNLAIKGIAMRNRSRGKHMITTDIEHASVFEAYKQLENLGFDVTYLPVNENGVVSVEDVKRALRDDTILVSMIHVNNETGAIQPVGEVGKLLANYPKVRFHVDHVQGIGKVPLDLYKNHIDLCTISGHKFHSVKGTGILYVRDGVRLDSVLSGGGQEQRYRSGTENLPGIVAMIKALRMTLEKQSENTEHLRALKEELIRMFKGMKDVTINTPKEHTAPHILNVSFVGLKPEVVVHALEERGVYVSTKSACSSRVNEVSHVLLAMGLPHAVAESAIRISLTAENTMEEVKQFEGIIKETLPKLYEVMR
ncbi:cysteine desulfurase family protein [Bacillus cereus group sp. BfR-BA-01380]|uniref:cysteine desulfurase family protein n=1 Tax=Bacillus cereus group sp. BfR-BA-01380 TaxID=2920324 RepID=UPI001F59956C|nr:cysteine desulfurase family protein [Bacillus cereus group sp. BfR-BA-01380]